ncbi:MAG: hypothetical protein COA69_05260 [Robiginitomaculum sp.]|nr:MAG: hypothetical protein COA69_05260 [Robiginitomaculum sp.]
MLKIVKITDGSENFFTPLRFVFAFMVLVGHAFIVVGGSSTFEPHIFYHYTSSAIAVNLFFIASGFLVTGSILYRKNLQHYVSARVLRIYPGLIVHVLVLAFVFGPLTTTLPLAEYFTHPDTLKQPFIVLTFIETEMALPGILPQNHEHMASAALWTLRYEVLAYIGTLIAFMLGLLNRRWMLFAQFAVFAIAYTLLQYLGIYEHILPILRSILRFGICYGLGAAIYGYREQLKFHIALIPVLFALAALMHNLVIFDIMVTLALGYALFWAAYVKIPALKFLQSMSDISYGLYIYHWAVLQGLYMYMPSLNVWQLIALSTPIAISISALSWHYVEKPALALKGKLMKPDRKLLNEH